MLLPDFVLCFQVSLILFARVGSFELQLLLDIAYSELLTWCLCIVIICLLFSSIDYFLQAVLRSNHGAVHATIDQLLTMTTDIEVDLMRERHQVAEQHQLASSMLPVPDVVAGVMEGHGRPPGSSPLGGSHSLSWDGRGSEEEGAVGFRTDADFSSNHE